MSASKLKFLVDVGVGKKVEEYLLEKRYDTKAVPSLDQSMPDQEIIRLAALPWDFIGMLYLNCQFQRSDPY
jgi:hypothetical protein